MSSTQRLLAAMEVFRIGAMVAEPATWKNRQVAVNAMVGLVSALAILAAQYGLIPDGIATEATQQFGEGLALAVLAIINILGTWGTSEKVGLPRKTSTED